MKKYYIRCQSSESPDNVDTDFPNGGLVMSLLFCSIYYVLLILLLISFVLIVLLTALLLLLLSLGLTNARSDAAISDESDCVSTPLSITQTSKPAVQISYTTPSTYWYVANPKKTIFALYWKQCAIYSMHLKYHSVPPYPPGCKIWSLVTEVLPLQAIGKIVIIIIIIIYHEIHVWWYTFYECNTFYVMGSPVNDNYD